MNLTVRPLAFLATLALGACALEPAGSTGQPGGEPADSALVIRGAVLPDGAIGVHADDEAAYQALAGDQALGVTDGVFLGGMFEARVVDRSVEVGETFELVARVGDETRHVGLLEIVHVQEDEIAAAACMGYANWYIGGCTKMVYTGGCPASRPRSAYGFNKYYNQYGQPGLRLRDVHSCSGTSQLNNCPSWCTF